MKNNIKKILGLSLAVIFASNFSSVALADDYSYESEETTIEMQVEETTVAEEITTAPKTVDFDFANMNVGNFKSYMDYRAITSEGSAQYKLQQVAYTGEYGIRTVDGRYLVAVAATFGVVGDKIDITTEKGEVIHCTIGDIKAYTDLLGGDSSLVEFIVDSDVIPDEVSLMGTFGVKFEGNVVKVTKILE